MRELMQGDPKDSLLKTAKKEDAADHKEQSQKKHGTSMEEAGQPGKAGSPGKNQKKGPPGKGGLGLCPHYARGSCWHGGTCGFSHAFPDGMVCRRPTKARGPAARASDKRATCPPAPGAGQLAWADIWSVRK